MLCVSPFIFSSLPSQIDQWWRNLEFAFDSCLALRAFKGSMWLIISKKGGWPVQAFCSQTGHPENRRVTCNLLPLGISKNLPPMSQSLQMPGRASMHPWVKIEVVNREETKLNQLQGMTRLANVRWDGLKSKAYLEGARTNGVVSCLC